MWEVWGVEISAFPLTWYIAYTTGCCFLSEILTGRRFPADCSLSLRIVS